MGSVARYVRRVLGRDPGPTALAIVSLAIAIGASTAIFSLADALFLRPLAVRAPDRLVYVKTRDETGRLQRLSFPECQDVRGVPAFEDVALFDLRGATYRDGDELELLLLAAVSDNYFSLVGVRPAVGRLFAPGLDRSGLSAAPVVISHRLWQRRFGGDVAIAGSPYA
jgi:putative ABC transport system permease protein